MDEQVRALGILKLTLAMNRDEWLAQLAPLVRAEGEVLALAHTDQQLLHCLLLSAPPQQAPEQELPSAENHRPRRLVCGAVGAASLCNN